MTGLRTFRAAVADLAEGRTTVEQFRARFAELDQDRVNAELQAEHAATRERLASPRPSERALQAAARIRAL